MPRQAANGVRPLWADCRLRCLPKSEDLTFPRPPNVIFCHFVDEAFFDYLQKKRCAVMPSYTAHNRRVLLSTTEGGVVTLLQVKRAQIAVTLHIFKSTSR